MFHLGPEVPPNASVLIFTSARPDSILFFGQASAVLFLKGGLLSHACSIAREQMLPCVTGLGPRFVQALNQSAPAVIRVEADTGLVTW